MKQKKDIIIKIFEDLINNKNEIINQIKNEVIDECPKQKLFYYGKSEYESKKS